MPWNSHLLYIPYLGIKERLRIIQDVKPKEDDRNRVIWYSVVSYQVLAGQKLNWSTIDPFKCEWIENRMKSKIKIERAFGILKFFDSDSFNNHLANSAILLR